MDQLAPIPIPLRMRWRQFRTRILPACLALLTLAGAAWLWSNQSASNQFSGLAEGVRAAVSSTQPGTVRQLLVEPYQIVQAGEQVAILAPSDPRTALDILQSELQLAQFSTAPSVPEQNAMDYERLRFDLLRLKSELATARVDLQRAENQVAREKPLFEQKLLSDDLFDLTAKTRDGILAEVEAKSSAVAQMELRLEELKPLGEPESGAPSVAFTLLSSLIARHRALVTNLGPTTLTAPIGGMISGVQRQAGEHLLPGEPVLFISSPRAERVVGYLRQPYRVQPEVGMEAVLTTREWKRRRYPGLVRQVGAQVELITNSLAFLRPGALVDPGLPIVIELPPGVPIRPGEIVDVTIQHTPATRTAVFDKAIRTGSTAL
jgi:HlyD family secretion protein